MAAGITEFASGLPWVSLWAVRQPHTGDFMTNSDNSFLARARYPKGRKTLQAILDATYELIIAEGPTAASQQAIADRARVTQSAVRHYFPTKDDLLMAFFTTGIERMKSVLMAKFGEEGDNPRQLLLECAELQFARIRDVDDVYFFEATAFARRNSEFALLRGGWYQLVCQKYQQLLQRMHPQWSDEHCADTAYQVMTLVMGGWITAGRSHLLDKQARTDDLIRILRRGIERLID